MAAEDRKLKTMDLKGNAYAKVAERMRQFRSDWPRGKTESHYIELESGITEFRVWGWKNKDDYMDALKSTGNAELARGSADADGFARKKLVGDKDFEKLQTIATGRMLAMLGYLSSGEVASFEEMEDFMEGRKKAEAEKYAQAILAAKEALDKAGSNEELNQVFKDHSAAFKHQDVVDAAKARRAEINGEKPAEKPQEKAPEQPKPETNDQPADEAEEIPDADN